MIGHRSIRIVSDGTPMETHVYDSETGQEVVGIREIEYFYTIDSIPMADITYVCPEMEVVAQEEWIDGTSFLAEMKSLAPLDTTELHQKMDDLLCKTVCLLARHTDNRKGFEEGVAIFRETPKWYS